MKRKQHLLFPLAVVLILTTFICSASAYFTTYADARGGYTINLQGEHRIEETVADWIKHVTISSTGNVDYWVRAKGIGPDVYPLQYSGNGWSDGHDGWYYYESILPGGEETAELQIQITDVSDADAEDFEVVVVYECVPVTYDSENNPDPDSAYGAFHAG